MATRRTYGSYHDGCAAAHALDLVGDRWALIVARELLLGPKRFIDLQRDVIGIGPSALARCLQGFVDDGIATRRRLPSPISADVYELTKWGTRLEGVNAALSAWAVDSPGLPLEADMSPDTLVLAMRAHARGVPDASGDERVHLALIDSRRNDADAVAYVATVRPETTTIERATDATGTSVATTRIRASTRDFKRAIILGEPLDDLPGVEIEGDRAAAERLVAATRLDHEASG